MAAHMVYKNNLLPHPPLPASGVCRGGICSQMNKQTRVSSLAPTVRALRKQNQARTLHCQTRTPPITLAVSSHRGRARTSVVPQFVHHLHNNKTVGIRHRSTGTTEGAPPSLRRNAPNIMRKASHLYSQGITAGGGQAAGKGWRDRRGTANAVRNAVSRSWFSQPKPYLERGGASVQRRCGAVKKDSSETGRLKNAYMLPKERNLRDHFGVKGADHAEKSARSAERAERLAADWLSTYPPLPRANKKPNTGLSPCKVQKVNSRRQTTIRDPEKRTAQALLIRNDSPRILVEELLVAALAKGINSAIARGKFSSA